MWEESSESSQFLQYKKQEESAVFTKHLLLQTHEDQQHEAFGKSLLCNIAKMKIQCL